MEQVKCCRCCRMLSNGISHRNWVVYVVRVCECVCLWCVVNWWSAVWEPSSLLDCYGKWAKCESQLKVITLLLVIYKIIFKSLNGDCIQHVCVFFKHFPTQPTSFIHTLTQFNAFIQYDRPMENSTRSAYLMASVIKGFWSTSFFFPPARYVAANNSCSITFYKKINAFHHPSPTVQNEMYLFRKRIACNKRDNKSSFNVRVDVSISWFLALLFLLLLLLLLLFSPSSPLQCISCASLNW